jgi:hypothetical protein
VGRLALNNPSRGRFDVDDQTDCEALMARLGARLY